MSLSLAAVAAMLVADIGAAWAQAPLAADLGPIRILQSQSLTDDDDETASDISGSGGPREY